MSFIYSLLRASCAHCLCPFWILDHLTCREELSMWNLWKVLPSFRIMRYSTFFWNRIYLDAFLVCSLISVCTKFTLKYPKHLIILNEGSNIDTEEQILCLNSVLKFHWVHSMADSPELSFLMGGGNYGNGGVAVGTFDHKQRWSRQEIKPLTYNQSPWIGKIES
jgi:hypothetical protein